MLLLTHTVYNNSSPLEIHVLKNGYQNLETTTEVLQGPLKSSL
jgi:hypothetical protein